MATNDIPESGDIIINKNNGIKWVVLVNKESYSKFMCIKSTETFKVGEIVEAHALWSLEEPWTIQHDPVLKVLYGSKV